MEKRMQKIKFFIGAKDARAEDVYEIMNTLIEIRENFNPEEGIHSDNRHDLDKDTILLLRKQCPSEDEILRDTSSSPERP